MKSQKGFTLIELLIAIGVTTILLGAVYMAVDSVQRNSSGIERRVVAQQDVKAALDLMAMEIAMASYNPSFTATGIWRANTNCNIFAPKQLYRGIQEAEANALTIQMDLNGNGNILGVNDENELIRYFYVSAGSDRYITRSVSCGVAMPFLGASVASNDAQNVRVINSDLNPSIPIFRYFDGQGVEITQGITNNDLPVRIPDIRRIEITLAVETEHINPNTGQRQRLIYSTSVIPRNHVITSY